MAVLGGLMCAAAVLTARAQTVGVNTVTGRQMDDAADPLANWLPGFRARSRAAGILQNTLDLALGDVQFLAGVIAKDRNQAEFSKSIWDYLDSAVSTDRLADGHTALSRHQTLLDRIEARYPIEREVLVAIWGLESRYGTHRGDIPVISALATLASDGRRAAFFETQLLAALQIIQTKDISPDRMLGSWAGAMGHTQFMPTSYLAHAVDFTGDGRGDIWADDPADALASTAAYLLAAGWRHGVPWGVEVALPATFDHAQSGKSQVHTTDVWRHRGVLQVSGAPLEDHGPCALLLPAGANGPAFLITSNFAVIAAYNAADAYVVAVGHLADRLAGGQPIHSPWPRGERALTLSERKELQTRLTKAGFDAGAPDGIFGPNSINALRRYQKLMGLPADGYANLAILERLR